VSHPAINGVAADVRLLGDAAHALAGHHHFQHRALALPQADQFWPGIGRNRQLDAEILIPRNRMRRRRVQRIRKQRLFLLPPSQFVAPQFLQRLAMSFPWVHSEH
jgi:hypothetical protein